MRQTSISYKKIMSLGLSAWVVASTMPHAAWTDDFDAPLPRTLTDADHWLHSSDDSTTFIAPKNAEEHPDPVAQGKQRLLEGSERLITRMKLTIKVGGFDSALPATEEYRLDHTDPSGQGTIYFSDAFWSSYFRTVDIADDHDTYASYLVYVLLRAEAEWDYSRYYDAEHFAWVTQGDAEWITPSLRVLKRTLEIPNTSWEAFDGPMSQRDEDFRRSLSPDGNPARTLQALIQYAFTALSHRSADLYALAQYQNIVGAEPPN
jgi:hypothetical protein